MSDSLRDAAVEAVGISVGNKTMVAGAGTGLAGWLASLNWVGICGVLIALAGLAINYYFQRRRDHREAAESAARLEAIKARCDGPQT